MFEQQLQRVDQLFAKWDQPDSPGAALAIVKDGQIIYKRGYGQANLEYDIPIGSNTIFHVASVSKQFTALAIALLANEGRLSLDDEYRKYIPEAPDFGRAITIGHLVHHTSGLRDQWELLVMAGWRMDDVITSEHIMKIFSHQQELNFEPGAEFLYCNTGYTLMAEIVARVSGQSFRDFAQERIFKPLGMDSTHFHHDHQEIVKNRAYSYAPLEEGGWRKSVLSYANVGATSLFTTAEDLAKWLWNFDTHQVGGPKVIEQMHERFTLNNGELIDYAFGLREETYRGLRLVGHSGADAGFRSFCGRFPDHGLGVIILSNLSTFTPPAMALKVAEVFLAEHMEPVVEPTSSGNHTDTKPAELVGRYLVNMAGVVVEIAPEGESLVAYIDGHSKGELTQQGPLRYHCPALKDCFEFKVDEQGSVVELLMPRFGMKLPGKRFTPRSISAEQINEYVGDYYSPELGTTYTIAQQGDQLVVQHRRHEDFRLLPMEEGIFHGLKGGSPKLEFYRRDGALAGFRLTGGRVRHLNFQRV